MTVQEGRGLAGLDVLILFIAIVLVAAVVAALLTSSNMALTQRAKAVESEKRKGIQNPITIESIRGRDTNGDRRLDELIATARLQDSSEPLRLNETLIFVVSKATNCTALKYGTDPNIDCTYTVEVGKRGNRYHEGEMNVGDLIEFHYSGPTLKNGVEDTNAAFTFVPPEGYSTQVKFNIPERIPQPNTGLWPLND